MEQSTQQIRHIQQLITLLHTHHKIVRLKNDYDDETNNMLWWDSASWNEMPVMAHNIPDSRQLQDYPLRDIADTYIHINICTLFNMDHRTVESVEN